MTIIKILKTKTIINDSIVLMNKLQNAIKLNFVTAEIVMECKYDNFYSTIVVSHF